MTLFSQIDALGNFVKHLKLRARFGELSRAPLQLLRIEMENDKAECEWLARGPDVWDSGLPESVGQKHASAQALQDAIAVRNLLFHYLPHVQRLSVCVYRQSSAGVREPIITGLAARAFPPPKELASLVMRAKLAGFQFRWNNDVLENLHPEALAANF